MSYADQVFIDNIKNILENGTSDEDQMVRPRWEDGTPAHTIALFGVVNRYDLKKEFPIMTLRRTYWKSAWDEISWIWQKKSNDVHQLKSHVWDAWANEQGTIGKAYGYQMGIKHHYPQGDMDQVDRVIWQLQNEPASRRIMTNLYNHHDLSEMALYPCAYSVTFTVVGGKLNIILNQRSQDMLTASNWNVVQYAMIAYCMASAYGFEPGEMIHVIANCHIYDRHVDICRELIKQPVYEAPKFTIDPSVKDFYSFTPDSFKLENYQYNPFTHTIPVAV